MVENDERNALKRSNTDTQIHTQPHKMHKGHLQIQPHNLTSTHRHTQADTRTQFQKWKSFKFSPVNARHENEMEIFKN